MGKHIGKELHGKLTRFVAVSASTHKAKARPSGPCRSRQSAAVSPRITGRKCAYRNERSRR